MTEKMIKEHVNASIFKGFCPACGNRSLTHPRNKEWGGLVCKTEGCLWKNVYYIGPKSKSSAGILIDMTDRNKRYSINMCNYCHDDNGKSTPKPILPSDKYARHTDKGDYKCGVCVGEETKRLLNMFGGRQKQ